MSAITAALKNEKFSIDYKSRSLHPEKPKEHEVFKTMPVTGDIKLFLPVYHSTLHASSLRESLIYLMKPLTFGLANIVHQSNMLQLMASQVVQWTWFHKGCFGSTFQVIESSFPCSAFYTAVSSVKLLIFK